MNNDAILLAYYRLAYKILDLAIRDMYHAYPARRWEARRWLAFSPLAGDLLDAFNINRIAVIDTIRELAYNESRVEETLKNAPG